MEIEIKDKRFGCLSLVMWFLLVFFAGMVLIGLGSCKSVKYIPVETIKHDSIYITNHQKDSVYIHDSIYQKEKGDTLILEKWHTKYVEKQVHDTTFVERWDSIYVPYPVERERKATFKELFFYQIGKYSIIPIIALVVLIIICVKKRLFF